MRLTWFLAWMLGSVAAQCPTGFFADWNGRCVFSNQYPDTYAPSNLGYAVNGPTGNYVSNTWTDRHGLTYRGRECTPGAWNVYFIWYLFDNDDLSPATGQNYRYSAANNYYQGTECGMYVDGGYYWGEFFELEISEPVLFNSVDLAFSFNGAYVFRIGGSNDGGTFTTVLNVNQATAVRTPRQRFALTQSTAYKYYRIVINRITASDFGTISTMFFFKNCPAGSTTNSTYVTRCDPCPNSTVGADGNCTVVQSPILCPTGYFADWNGRCVLSNQYPDVYAPSNLAYATTGNYGNWLSDSWTDSHNVTFRGRQCTQNADTTSFHVRNMFDNNDYTAAKSSVAEYSFDTYYGSNLCETYTASAIIQAEWFQLESSIPLIFSGVDLAFYDSGAKHFNVYGSNDNSMFTLLFFGYGSYSVPRTRFTFTQTTPFQYFRLTISATQRTYTYATVSTMLFYTACPAGSTVNTTGFSRCDTCPGGLLLQNGTCIPQCTPGTWSADGRAPCTSCGAGLYSSTAGATSSSTCTPCGTGTFSTAGASTCLLCSGGTYATQTSASACSLCASGTFSTASGAVVAATCALCASGTYSSGSGSTGPCTQCSSGTYSTASGAIASTTCTPCAAGTTSTALGASSGTTCALCIAGTYSSGLGIASPCTQCSSGTYSTVSGAIASTTCTPCAAGTTSTALGASSGTTCALCASGTYSSSAGSAGPCLPCTGGTYSTASGAVSVTTCAQCVAGQYSTVLGASSTLSCTQCISGTYSTVLGAPSSTTCTQCISGTYSTVLGAPSTLSCDQCVAGTYTTMLGASSSLGCAQCTSGTYSTVLGAPSSTTCVQCTAGTYSTALGAPSALSCTECISGTYSTVFGALSSVVCIQCVSGTYSSTLGASVSSTCTSCISGTYSTVVGAPSLTTCAACSSGTYAVPGSTSCANCSQGFFANASGASACTPCASGYYNNVPGASACVACLANSWCAAGTLNTCPQHATSPPLSALQNACLCDAGYFGDGSVAGTSPCAQCWPNYHCPGGNGNLSYACPSYSTAPAGSISLDQCVCNTDYVRTASNTCECAPNRVCTSNGSTLCPANSSSAQGASNCVCDPGFYGDANVGECTPCPVGSYCPGAGVLTKCTGNATTAAERASSPNDCFCEPGFLGVNNSMCAPCPADSWCWTGIANACPAHSSAPPLATYMENCSCDAGYVGAAGGPCFSCPPNHYCDGAQQTQCPPYSSSPELAQTLADCRCNAGFVDLQDPNVCVCAPGSRLIDDTCVQCEADTWCTNNVQTACSALKTAPAGSVNAAACVCVAGFGGSACVPCMAGSFKNVTGNNDCTLCALGTYNNIVAATSCTTCEIGASYNGTPTTTNTGATSALDCSCGDLAQRPDGSCVSFCAPGYYADANYSCHMCPQGSFCTNNVLTACPTQYSAVPGSSVCFPCPGPDTHSNASLVACGLLPCAQLGTPQLLAPNTSAVGLVNLSANGLITMTMNSLADRAFAELRLDVGPLIDLVYFEVQGAADALLVGYNNEPSSVWSMAPLHANTWLPVSIPINDTTIWVRAVSLTQDNHVQLQKFEIARLPLEGWAPRTAIALGANGTFELLDTIELAATVFPDEIYELTFWSNATPSISLSVDGGVWNPVFSHMFSAFAPNVRLRIEGGVRIAAPQLVLAGPRCKMCIADHSCANDSIQACPVDTNTPEGASVCACANGFYGPGCGPCAANHYCVDNMQHQCPIGSKSAPGATVCTACAANEFCKDGELNVCVDHAQPISWPSLTVHNCTCDAGYFGPNCTECDEGHYCGGNGERAQCPAGTFNAARGKVYVQDCLVCGAGQWSDLGALQCTSCAAGTFSLSTGLLSQAACSACTVGYYCPGRSNRVPCAAGTFSAQPGLQNQSQCNQCPQGSYCAGGSSVQLCPLGTFSPVTGIASAPGCAKCPGGFYCPNPLTLKQCPANTLAPPGAQDLGECICEPGYKCKFQNVIHAEVVLPVTIDQFETIREQYIAAVAAAAGVSPSQVEIVSVTNPVPGGGRRRALLANNLHFTEVHVSIHNHRNQHRALSALKSLNKYLEPHGLYAVSNKAKIHHEVHES